MTSEIVIEARESNEVARAAALGEIYAVTMQDLALEEAIKAKVARIKAKEREEGYREYKDDTRLKVRALEDEHGITEIRDEARAVLKSRDEKNGLAKEREELAQMRKQRKCIPADYAALTGRFKQLRLF